MSDENTSPTFESPFDQLVTLEEPEDDWASVDYRALGLTSEHVGELAQIALEIDAAATDPEYYASVHAWRALAQFGDEAAIAPLDDLLRRPKTEDDDWIIEEVPEVLARLGPPATATSLALLADDTVSSFVRVSIMTALRSLARNHPSERDTVVAGLVAELQKSSNDEEFVGFVVSSLVELGAVEAAPAIQRAYEEHRVAEWIPGDWEDVQVGLGILEKRLTPKPRYVTPGLPPLPGWAPRAEPNPSPAGGGPAKNKAKAKAKKKQEAKSRKKNRRK